jgi:two-component system chemotaxis sensor kinase CheA
VAAGKPVEGCLQLRAYHEGGQVNIEITDDGAGLNLDRIRQKGVERGLLTADQASRLSDRDAAQLIFAPGFSTAEKVTSVSGRGVGMDVVKTNIERISGTIDLQTRPGQGTTVKIKIPLTLAIIPALVVTNDGDRYAIPQVSLLELVRLDGEEAKQSIEYVHGAPVYRLRGKLLPLVYLSERLGLSRKETASDATCVADDVINIVVLRANDRQFGLVVDKVNDTEEIVVKPLSRQLKGLSEFAGATIMGDGTIALILDVMGLAVAAGLAGEMREQGLVGSSKSEEHEHRQLETLLVVDLGDSRRFALPTSMISRLEKVTTDSIEYADGREVIQYRGAIMPLMRLSEVFGGCESTDAHADELQIVVYADQDFRCGLVVNRIVDIVETELDLSKSRGAEDNLLGTSVIQERVTDVLNLRRLARRPAAPKFAVT